jgi:tetratricopeptide (TPR) repeat protein
LRDSAAARAEGRLDVAVSLAREAIKAHPGNPEARQSLAQAERDLAASQATRSHQCQQCVDRARRALQSDDLDAAERFLQLARKTGVGHPDLASVSALVAAERHTRDTAAALIGDLSAEFARARQEFRENKRAAAISRIEALAARHPSEAAPKLEAERLRAEDERLSLAERSRHEAERFASMAADAMARDDDVAAIRLAEEALALVPGLEVALRTSLAAHVRTRERAERSAREERARKFLESAKSLFARGRYEQAIKNARRAAEFTPLNAAALSLIGEAVRRIDDAAAEQARSRDAARQTAALHAVLALATRAERARDFGGARLLAAQGLLLDPDAPTAAAVLAKVATSESALAALEDRMLALGGSAGSSPSASRPALRQARAVAWKVAFYLGSRRLWRVTSRWVRLRRDLPVLVASRADSAPRADAPPREP